MQDVVKIMAGVVIMLLLDGCSMHRAAKVKAPETVVILGNSIVRHGPSEALGWYGDWGMAASAESLDFVHVLERKIRSAKPHSKVIGGNLYTFERDYVNFNTADLDPFRDADLLILKFSENVDAGLIEKQDFKKHYLRILDNLTAGKPRKIVLADGFWASPVNDVVRAIADERKFPFIQLHDLSRDSLMTAKGLFKHTGVANHPSDKGMAAIADRIWEKIEVYYTGRNRQNENSLKRRRR